MVSYNRNQAVTIVTEYKILTTIRDSPSWVSDADSGVRRGGPRGPWPPPMAAPKMGGQERNVRSEASGQVLSL